MWYICTLQCFSKKNSQIEAHGAKVHIIPGSREDTAKAALNAVERGEGFYASHVYNPFFYQGTKTYAYEIYEQLNGEIITASEEDIPKTKQLLAKKGFYVEPTTAATFVALFDYIKKNDITKNGKVIIPLCGSGLKSK